MIRVVVALVVAVAGFPLAARPFPITLATWFGWAGVALLAGAIAGRPRHVWTIWLALAVMAVIAPTLGWLDGLRKWAIVSASLAVVVATLGFLAGTSIHARITGADVRRWWAGAGRARRRTAIGVPVLAILAFVGYVAFAFVAGGEAYTAQAGTPGPCDNPGQRYGWSFEPINYDGSNEPRTLDPAAAKVPCATYGPPAGTEVVTSDGVGIAGWYVPAATKPDPTGPTVLIVHGGKTDKTGALIYAEAFHADYNVVLIDLRNSGQSGGDTSSGGLYEQRDVRAMLDWLERTKHPRWIAVMGNSNGGATALAEARTDPRVRALIVDSMHARVELQLGSILEREQPWPAWPTAMSMVAGAAFRLGGDPTSVDPERTIAEVGSRPILLVHGSADEVDRPFESVELNLRAAIDAGIDVELHVCPGAGHGAVQETCPAAWERWVTTFLSAHGSGV